MSTSSYKKGDPYSHAGAADKMAIFQECLQQFNATPVNARKCRQLLARLLRLIYTGEVFPSQESTTLFFSISKLFQHKDASLRQLVYLAIKELSSTSQDILMVTSSIMKDIQSGDLIYKPNAIRTLSKVLDPTTVSASERLFKNAIVDKNPIVSSAALTSSYNLLPIAKDVVKRFNNETLETIQSFKQFPPDQFQLHEYYGGATTSLPTTSYMYQYHALSLLYELRNHDKMSLMKLITSLSDGSSLRNSLAVIQLIRFINKVLLDDDSLIQHLLPILINFLKHKSDSVELEACKTIISLQHLISKADFANVVNTLQKLLSVPRTATRFAAIRLINKISVKHPKEIITVNQELENLINDSNRSISTLAITTLLRTIGAGTVESDSTVEVGSESVDRLINKMTSLMDDITEDFKIVIIEAIENLALKFQSKHKKLVSFLTDLLKDEGSLELKSSIVDTLFDLIKFLKDKDGKQAILMSLCEFIEDCEYTELSVRILHLLGDEGPNASNPSYYIRHIYNRLVLDNSIIRSSAVIALSKFAVICGGKVSQNIQILLSRCLNDVDDEVRDRAALSLKFIANNEKNLIVNESKYDLAVLENKLIHYLNNESNFADQFDINEIPAISNEELTSLEYENKLNRLDKNDEMEVEPTSTEGAKDDSNADQSNDLLKQQEFEQEISQVAEFKDYGKLTKSSIQPIYLTEKENEFVVTCHKHFFLETSKVVLQYNITNTVNHLIAQDVSVIAQSDNPAYVEEFILSVDELRPNETGTIYVSFTSPSLAEDELVSVFGNTLSYTNREIIDDEGNIDESDEGWTDEYQIGDLEILPGDFIQPLYNSNFDSVFDQLPLEDSTVVHLKGIKTLENAITKLKDDLNMLPLDGTDYVPSDSNSHILKLFGRDVWGGKVGILVRLALTGGKLVAKLQVKTETEHFSNTIVDGVGV
ncbi:coatomer subunit gamma [Yamadazyma tenuis]|uniref:Coatomer subunit gamma n=1 Tax=Candida tenuis (strain ATCC 10573 / BCRC 21748 / CBS 615 / JCM 9827 / NBRC 10315 / NRRL Y-1498 / VKM Y-70) TaxID=590646 RepID=G3BA75_CANTC|nr:uncharacterized protein CANTEDRAFT_109562 [Yamadazyma tenuis ATCC 10573]EGV61376.1 hypothetical protein CANTEDRAFT_109562 [Yamadazyma tenuis ATCC 10573]WEJ92591.1 coatomer subunit gamma [Yamadazyma tenuis]